MIIDAPLWLTLKLETVRHIFKGDTLMENDVYTDEELTTFDEGQDMDDFLADLD